MVSSTTTVIQTIKKAITQGNASAAISAFESCNLTSFNEPDEQELLYLATVAYRQLNQLEFALKYATKLISVNDKHARIQQELGYVFSAKNNYQQAAKAFYEATRRNPALLSSWRALVPLYEHLGNTQAALIAKQQIQTLSALPKQILGARDLFHEGKVALADQVCRQFLQANKHQVDAMLLLAEIGINLKVYTEAEFLLETSVALHPSHLPTGLEYLKLLSKMGKFNGAKNCAEQLLKQHPDNTLILTAKASAMVGLGELEDAIQCYQALIDNDPKRPTLWLLLGHALKAQGDFNDAIHAYQQAYTFDHEFGDAYWSLANTKTYQFTEIELNNMLALTHDDGVQVDNKVHVLFALGKAFEDSKSFAKSFQYYAQGNALKQQQLQYDASFIERQVERQIEHVSTALIQKYTGSKTTFGEPAPDPIFIVGLPRSGSTLLEQILASHSQVDGTMELHNILGLVSRLRGQKIEYPEILSQIEADYFRRFGQQYLNETQVYRSGAPLFIDKMPNNFVHIGLIKLILPNAKVIDARRHPMACCFSGFKQLFGEGQEFSYSLENIARYYNAYKKVMAHWDKVLPGFVLRVEHEDVINDLDGQVRRLLDFCELPFEQACVDFHRTQRVIKTPSSEQVRQPIYRSGMQQWRNYEDYLSPLKDVLDLDSKPD